MKEIWKDLLGYEGLYQISSFGNVLSFHKKDIKILKPGKNKGYLQVILNKNSKGKCYQIHQLVAMAFLDFIPNGKVLVVDHINGIKHDNRLLNLQIISQRENSSKDRKGYTSRFIGVCWNSEKKKWQASITINNKQIVLAKSDNELDMKDLYEKAVLNLHTFSGDNKEFRNYLKNKNLTL